MAEKTAVAGLGQARIAGRVQTSRRTSSSGETVYRTILKLPAADQYSSPGTVEVRSGERLGTAGDELSIIVAVGGYSRSYDGKGADGDTVKIQTAENVLSFVGFA